MRKRLRWLAQRSWETSGRWTKDPVRIAVLVFAMGVLGFTFTRLRPRSFTVSMAVLPEADGQSSQIRALAGALGPFSGGALSGLVRGGISLTPEFIARAARSDTVLLSVARAAGDSGEPPIYRRLKRRGRSPADSLMNAVRSLRKRVTAETDRRTPIVSIAVRTRDSTLSIAIAERLLQALNEVLVTNRQTAVSSERRFLEQRHAQARVDLRTAEDQMRAFLERNRTYEQSPALVFEHQRLQRQIDLAQEIYVTAARQLQIAAADEIRNTPVLNILEWPRPPTRPDRRRGPLFAIAFAALALAAVLVVRLAHGFDSDVPVSRTRGSEAASRVTVGSSR